MIIDGVGAGGGGDDYDYVDVDVDVLGSCRTPTSTRCCLNP